MVQRSRFHQIRQSPPNQESRTEIIEPVLGLNLYRPATDLKPGETPFSQNYVANDRYLQQRSGASQWGSISATSVPLGFVSSYQLDRVEIAAVFSTVSASYRSGSAANWAGITITEPLSSNTSAYYSAAAIVAPLTSAVVGPQIVITNAERVPKLMGDPGNSLVTLSTFFSIDSYARYVTVFDTRIILFNSGTSMAVGAVQHPTRAAWSSRGSLQGFASGGFEDIIDMQGSGTGIVAERDRLVLFSNRETWSGIPRRDAYAFDFFPLDKGKGCPQENDKTPKNTEAGTIWLGAGSQFMRLAGNEVRPLGDKVRSLLLTEQREWPLAFSIYNPQDHIYGYFYSDTTGEYPTKALFLRTDTIHPVDVSRDDGVWFLQDWGTAFQFSIGGVFGGDMVLFSSTGTPYRLRSTQTTDSGTSIDCRWRSHALRAERDLYPFEMLQEMWLEYEGDGTQTSTISVHQSTDNGGTFSAIASSSLTTGINYPLIPVSTVAASRNQFFELRENDGARPKIARMHMKLRGYSGRLPGAS